jgi:hypothetical protein
MLRSRNVLVAAARRRVPVPNRRFSSPASPNGDRAITEKVGAPKKKAVPPPHAFSGGNMWPLVPILGVTGGGIWAGREFVEGRLFAAPEAEKPEENASEPAEDTETPVEYEGSEGSEVSGPPAEVENDEEQEQNDEKQEEEVGQVSEEQGADAVEEEDEQETSASEPPAVEQEPSADEDSATTDDAGDATAAPAEESPVDEGDEESVPDEDVPNESASDAPSDAPDTVVALVAEVPATEESADAAEVVSEEPVDEDSADSQEAEESASTGEERGDGDDDGDDDEKTEAGDSLAMNTSPDGIIDHLLSFEQQEALQRATDGIEAVMQELDAVESEPDSGVGRVRVRNMTDDAIARLSRVDLERLVEERTAYEVRARAAVWRHEVARGMTTLNKTAEELQLALDEMAARAGEFEQAAADRAQLEMEAEVAKLEQTLRDDYHELQALDADLVAKLTSGQEAVLASLERQSRVAALGANAAFGYMQANDCVESGRGAVCADALAFLERVSSLSGGGGDGKVSSSSLSLSLSEEEAQLASLVRAIPESVTADGIVPVERLRDDLAAVAREVRVSRKKAGRHGLRSALVGPESNHRVPYDVQRMAEFRAAESAAEARDEFARARAMLHEGDVAGAVAVVSQIPSGELPASGERWLDAARARVAMVNVRDGARVLSERSLATLLAATPQRQAGFREYVADQLETLKSVRQATSSPEE